MMENPPGFVVRTEAQKAAWDNGFRIERDTEGAWLRFVSTTAPCTIWIAGNPSIGPWLLSVDHFGVASEASELTSSPFSGPGVATFIFDSLMGLHNALDRIYKLAVSLPDAPLARFRASTAGLPRTTEAERLVVERIGQNIFRNALIDYWGGCCPLTGITELALLRASHIVPWSECSDEERLDVHNGLLLSALWDAAFDRGLVSFNDDGTVLVNPLLDQVSRRTLAVDTAPPLSGIRAAHRENLSRHRQRYGY